MAMKTAFGVLVCLGTLVGVACGPGTVGGGGDGGSGDGGNVGQGGAVASSSTTGGGANQGGSSSTGTTTTSSSSSSTGSGPGSSSSSSTGGGPDPLEAARQECIDKINALRASKGWPPYARWKEAEACADQQATWDEMNNKPHGAWGMGLFPSCNGNGQNECLGQGVSGISGCLDQMWAEKDQAGCSGCDACNSQYTPNCPNCDFNGATVCGHYVNMSALYFSKAACGFSALGGWDVINFQ